MPEAKDGTLYEITKELMQVYQQIDNMTEDIESYKKDLTQKQNSIDRLCEESEGYQKEIESLNEVIRDKDFQINELQLEIERRDARLKKYEKVD
jgi:peptidoglycan hydrolase CwlO-like protein